MTNNPTDVAFFVCLMLAVAAAGCGTVQPHLAPTPAVLKDPRIAFERMLAPEMRTTRLPVYFATRREASGGPEHFGDGTAKAVAVGVARFTADDSHFKGAARPRVSHDPAALFHYCLDFLSLCVCAVLIALGTTASIAAL